MNIGLQGRINKTVNRRFNAVAAAELDHLAGKPGQFEPIAADQVVPHRRRVVRRHRAHLRECSVDDVRWQPHPFGKADGYGFAQGRLIEGQEIGIVAPLSERQPGQRVEPAERHQQDEFFPDRDHDIRAQHALEPRRFAEIPQRAGRAR